jgi:hypothetical protein
MGEKNMELSFEKLCKNFAKADKKKTHDLDKRGIMYVTSELWENTPVRKIDFQAFTYEDAVAVLDEFDELNRPASGNDEDMDDDGIIEIHEGTTFFANLIVIGAVKNLIHSDRKIYEEDEEDDFI